MSDSRVLDLLDTQGRPVATILIPSTADEVSWNFYTSPIFLGGIKMRRIIETAEASDD
jgi:hypothetical protein